MCQEENSGTKHLNEGLELPGEPVKISKEGAELLNICSLALSTVPLGLCIKASSQLFHTPKMR